MDDKIRKMLNEKFFSCFVGDWPFGKYPGRHPAARALSKRELKKTMSQWKSYLKEIGMRMVYPHAIDRSEFASGQKSGHCVPKKYIRDPATDWRNAPFGGEPMYIEIPREVALKILMLEALP